MDRDLRDRVADLMPRGRATSWPSWSRSGRWPTRASTRPRSASAPRSGCSTRSPRSASATPAWRRPPTAAWRWSARGRARDRGRAHRAALRPLRRAAAARRGRPGARRRSSSPRWTAAGTAAAPPTARATSSCTSTALRALGDDAAGQPEARRRGVRGAGHRRPRGVRRRARRPAARRRDPGLRHRQRRRRASRGDRQPARHGQRRRHGRGAAHASCTPACSAGPLRTRSRHWCACSRPCATSTGNTTDRRARQHPDLVGCALPARAVPRATPACSTASALLGDGTRLGHALGPSGRDHPRHRLPTRGRARPPPSCPARPPGSTCASRPGSTRSEAEDALIAHLRRPTRRGGSEVDRGDGGDGRAVPRARPTARRTQAHGAAMEEAYGQPMATLGQGGSIPLCNVLADTYPDAELILMGVEEPQALIHAPNESVRPRRDRARWRSPRHCSCNATQRWAREHRPKRSAGPVRPIKELTLTPHYERAWLRGDVLAGVSVTAYLDPAGDGLRRGGRDARGRGHLGVRRCAALLRALGSSRSLSVGPESTTALMTAAALGSVAVSRRRGVRRPGGRAVPGRRRLLPPRLGPRRRRGG